MLTNLVNCFMIQDLKSRVILTMAMLTVCRVIACITFPN